MGSALNVLLVECFSKYLFGLTAISDQKAKTTNAEAVAVFLQFAVCRLLFRFVLT